MPKRKQTLPELKEKNRLDNKGSKVNPSTGLRPWQENFWKEMIGKYPDRGNEIKAAMGKPGQGLTPEALWDMACLYFAGEGYDTMIRKDFIRSGEFAGKIVEMTTVRPFSWTSFGLFLLYKGIKCDVTEIKQNRDGKYPEFKNVIAQIGDVIRQQKFDGAAINVYNPQLIIRDLGLSEKVDANIKTEQPLFVDTPQPPIDTDGDE